jgi:amidophosphoribosyltransferase
MSRLGDFIAFRAAIALLKERSKEQLLQELYTKAVCMREANGLHKENLVKQIYKPFTTEELSDKIAQLITPADIGFPVEVIFQTIEDLHASCPTNTGDWYFTGNYPTAGGNKVVNKAFINYIEGSSARGY